MLVVDDSVSVRSIVTRSLSDDPAVVVVGTAANGVIGLAKMQQLNPDVVTLDIEMPEMDGLQMLKQLRTAYPGVVVIMNSTLTAPGARATLDALMLGADDYITKPSQCASLAQCIATLQAELLPKVKQFFAAAHSEPLAGAAVSRSTRLPAGAERPVNPEVIAIGVSTGGPNALSAILPTLPVPFPCPILIVQHMPPLFTRLLAERLQSLTVLRVEEATQGSTIEPGKITIAAGGFHMRAKKSDTGVVAALDQTAPRNSCRPSVDVLFESVNEVYGRATTAVVLTGMGQDGLRGVEVLKASGAHIIAQDEASSVVWGMPGFIARAGLADAVVPLGEIVPQILSQFPRGIVHAAAGR